MPKKFEFLNVRMTKLPSHWRRGFSHKVDLTRLKSPPPLVTGEGQGGGGLGKRITPIPTFPPQGGRRLRALHPIVIGTYWYLELGSLNYPVCPFQQLKRNNGTLCPSGLLVNEKD